MLSVEISPEVNNQTDVLRDGQFQNWSPYRVQNARGHRMPCLGGLKGLRLGGLF